MVPSAPRAGDADGEARVPVRVSEGPSLEAWIGARIELTQAGVLGIVLERWPG
jgi:hypothetical protein